MTAIAWEEVAHVLARRVGVQTATTQTRKFGSRPDQIFFICLSTT
jgi:hypothetical protein